MTVRLAAGLLAGALLAVPPEAGAMTADFKDWRVGCADDGERECVAEAGAEGAAILSIERTGAGAAGFLVAVELPEHGLNADRPLAFKISGGASFALLPGRQIKPYRTATRWYVVDKASLATLLPALLKADYTLVEYFDVTGELRSTPVSLAGLSDALAAIAAHQGAEGAPHVATAPEGLPEAAASVSEAVEEAGIPEAVLAQHLGSGACEDPASELLKGHATVTEPLTPAALLYAIPCIAGGGNVAYRLYIRDRGEIGGVQTLYFPTYSKAYGWGGTDLLHNVAVEGASLAATFKGRGTGSGREGCGTEARFTFVDYAYRLDTFRTDEACDGAPPERWTSIYPPR